MKKASISDADATVPLRPSTSALRASTSDAEGLVRSPASSRHAAADSRSPWFASAVANARSSVPMPGRSGPESACSHGAHSRASARSPAASARRSGRSGKP
jgi:hypothetical protein